MKKLAPLFAFAVFALAGSARAEDKTIKLPDYVIYGRAPRPMAVTEVTKLPVQTTMTELKQPFVQRVEQAVRSNPF
jgi:hypothetical protein